MTIKLDELKHFLREAVNIKHLPTTQHLDLKIECTGTEILFTKTNHSIWCQYSYQCHEQAKEKILVNEKTLQGICATCSEHEIVIVRSKKGISITAGDYLNDCSMQNLHLFPVMPEIAAEKTKLSKEVVERIYVAGKHIQNGVVKTNLSHVYMGMAGIFASNGERVYYHDTFGLPDAFFDDIPLAVVKPVDDLLFWTSKTHNFFESNGFKYAFLKHEVKAIDYSPIVNQKITDAKFTIHKSELLSFFTIVNYSKIIERPLAAWEQEGDVLKMIYTDANNNIIKHAAVSNIQGLIDQFTFSVDEFYLLLKAIPYETLIFNKLVTGHYRITTPEDENYYGMIVKYVNTSSL